MINDCHSLSVMEKEVLERVISEGKDKFTQVNTGQLLIMASFSAAHGNASGQKCLGDYYSDKIKGVNGQNLDEAKKWYTLAAKQGNFDALKALLDLYINGKISFSEVEVIIEMFLINESTDCGILCLLGKAYYAREMFGPAFKYLKMSTKNGDREAAMILIDLYLTGCGTVDPHPQKAVKLLKALKDECYAPALYKLAELYEGGLAGENKRPNKAFKLYRRAAEQGHESAISKIKKLDGKMAKKKDRKKKGYNKEDFFSSKYLCNINNP